MAIHHDKLAYGRLDSLKEDSSEEKLKSMARRLSESKGDEPPEPDEPRNPKAPLTGEP